MIRATPGDGRPWEAIRGWATSLGPLLLASSEVAIVGGAGGKSAALAARPRRKSSRAGYGVRPSRRSR